MIDDPNLPPPVVAVHVAGNRAEITWGTRGIAHDSFILWTSQEARWCGPGESTAAMDLHDGTHAAAVRAVGSASIGAWSEPVVIQIGDVVTDPPHPPASWCMAEDFAGLWIVIGPGVWSGRVFSDRDSACLFMETRARTPGDLNDDGHANSQDFFDFITLFMASRAGADWNGDGQINGQDFFDFLNDLFR